MPVLNNPRHELFAQGIAKGVPASKAYVDAGYTANDANAARLNGEEQVQARVAELLELAARKAGVTLEAVVVELAKIGFADIRRCVRWGFELKPAPKPRGRPKLREADETDRMPEPEVVAGFVDLVPSSEIDDDTAAAIAEVQQTANGVRLKMYDKRAALVDLGRHLGAFIERSEVKVSRTLEDLVAESYALARERDAQREAELAAKAEREGQSLQ